MPDPFGRALDHRYALERKIAEVEGWKDRRLFLVHALAFPDISVHQLVLAPDAPPQIVADRNDLADMAAVVERVLAYHEGSRDRRVAPGPEGEAMLEELLAPTFRIEVPMAALFEEEDRQLVELTAQQAALLNHFGRDRRMVVTGCTGSAKTMLAVERARQLAAAGRRVLLVCFNKALCAHLQETAGAEGLEFSTFQGLCARLAHRAGVAPAKPEDTAPPEYFSDALPDALVEAIGVLGGQYDDILVDEAHDLRSDWLAALTFTLRDDLAVITNRSEHAADLQKPGQIDLVHRAVTERQPNPALSERLNPGDGRTRWTHDSGAIGAGCSETWMRSQLAASSSP